MSAPQYEVIVAGAGPVGLTLAIDLGRKGIRTLIVERAPTPAPWPKMDRTNARSMELFRRLGIADRVRALGYPPDNPMDVFLLTRMNEPPVSVLKFGSVQDRRREIAACTDGSLPVEPYQLVSQNTVEPLLKDVAQATPNVTVRYGHELIALEQDEQRVRATLKLADGAERSVDARYLVGCDGASSTVRKCVGVPLEGQGRIRELRQVIFWSDDLYERIPVGKGRHYNFIDGSVIVAQGGRKEFTLHTALPEDTDFHAVLRDLIGFDCDLQVKHVLTWYHNLLLAQRYRVGRVLMAGDAVHLVIPTGGLGMNSGLGDAIDLSWKLAGTIRGWGGAALLDSYERERRPVGRFNVDSAGWAAEGVGVWRALVTDRIREDSPEGAALRAKVAATFDVEHGRMHGMRGAEFGYTYADSPLVAPEPGNVATWDRNVYTPNARPGSRLPHMWLKDGRAMQDVLGDGYTLLDLKGDCDAAPLAQAFADLGAPFEVVRMDEPRIAGVYGRSVLLLRPDLHVAWSGHAPVPPPRELARRVTGHL